MLSALLPRGSRLIQACIVLVVVCISVSYTIPMPARAEEQSDAIDRGRYLAIAADCGACHTYGRQGQPFAGGYPMTSPFGIIYSSNITPSKAHGIGNYTQQQFAVAVREGIKSDGTRLYPAMPYTSYAGLTDQDVADLYAYFMHGVQPADLAAPETQLAFPFSIRATLAIWNQLNLRKVSPDITKGALDEDGIIERGRYLVDTLAHCGECHTPRNWTDGLAQDFYLRGAEIGPWHAPNLTPDPLSGLGSWSDQDLKSYLKTGISKKGRAAGPMAEAIEHSLQYLRDEDIDAITAYLHQLAPMPDPFPASRSEKIVGRTLGAVLETPRHEKTTITTISDGALLYRSTCASCHQPHGNGTSDGFYPAFSGSSSLQPANQANLIATILYGVDRTVGGREILMPNFGSHSLVQSLTDPQVASLATYIVNQFGNGAATFTTADVATIRAAGKQPWITYISDTRLWGGLAVLIGFLAGAAIFAFVREPKLQTLDQGTKK